MRYGRWRAKEQACTRKGHNKGPTVTVRVRLWEASMRTTATTMSPGTVPEKMDGKRRPSERLTTEPRRSRKKNRKASSEEKGSEIGMTDSDGT
jgi:hypothetical protein